MRHHRNLIAIAALTVVAAGGHGAAGEGVAAAGPVSIEGASAAWTDRVEWGLGRFREAGLALPPLVISIHGDNGPCEGNSGLFHPAETPEVHLCTPSEPDSGPAKLITLHELAHAWAETQLTTEQQAAFVDVRRLETWADGVRPPYEWGAEHAAEVVSWGLMDEMGPIIRINDAEPEALLVAFRHLTNRCPLWSVGRDCPVPSHD